MIVGTAVWLGRAGRGGEGGGNGVPGRQDRCAVWICTVRRRVM